MQDYRQPYSVQNRALTFKTFSNNPLWIEWLDRLDGSYARRSTVLVGGWIVCNLVAASLKPLLGALL